MLNKVHVVSTHYSRDGLGVGAVFQSFTIFSTPHLLCIITSGTKAREDGECLGRGKPREFEATDTKTPAEPSQGMKSVLYHESSYNTRSIHVCAYTWKILRGSRVHGSEGLTRIRSWRMYEVCNCHDSHYPNETSINYIQILGSYISSLSSHSDS